MTMRLRHLMADEPLTEQTFAEEVRESRGLYPMPAGTIDDTVSQVAESVVRLANRLRLGAALVAAGAVGLGRFHVLASLVTLGSVAQDLAESLGYVADEDESPEVAVGELKIERLPCGSTRLSMSLDLDVPGLPVSPVS